MTEEAARHSTVFDSGRQHLADLYARALIGATEKSGVTETVVSELNSVVHDVFNKLPQFDATLISPRVPFQDKSRMLDKALAGKVSEQLLNFLKVLTRRGRFDCLRLTEQAAQRLLNQLRGKVEVHLRSAVPIEGELLSRVSDRLREALKSDVDISSSVDSELIGGLVVRVGDTVYDGSVANRLVRLREEALRKATLKMRQSLNRFVVAE